MINNVSLTGRLTRDPELKYTGSGTAVGKARFNPATEMNEYLEVEAVKPLVEA